MNNILFCIYQIPKTYVGMTGYHFENDTVDSNIWSYLWSALNNVSNSAPCCQYISPYPKCKPSTQTERMYCYIFNLLWCKITFRSKCCISVYCLSQPCISKRISRMCWKGFISPQGTTEPSTRDSMIMIFFNQLSLF